MMLVFETDEEETMLDGHHGFEGHVPEVGEHIDWQIQSPATRERDSYRDTVPIKKGLYRVERVTWSIASTVLVRVHLVAFP